jgi:hypothetical protein
LPPRNNFLLGVTFTAAGTEILNRQLPIVKLKEAKIWQKTRQNVVKSTPSYDLGKWFSPCLLNLAKRMLAKGNTSGESRAPENAPIGAFTASRSYFTLFGS